MGLFSLFATPMGYLLRWIYKLVPTYFGAIALFTLAVRLVLFPLSIKSQKSSADRARLAPKLERIQKKYAADRQKMQQKQQELYEKENVSMMGGCLPAIVQMLVLFSVIAVIYKPLAYVERVNANDLNTCVTAVETQLKEELGEKSKEYKQLESRMKSGSYYQEMYLMRYVDDEKYDGLIRSALVESGKTEQEAGELLDTIRHTKQDFEIFGQSLLEMPSYTGIRPNWLWVIAILSGLSAFASSILSTHYSKAGMTEEQAKMGGCSTNAMMYSMPLFSLIISFTVPAGVAVYWIMSNLLALVQTVVLNAMYNPAKIRQQAELEYAERRRRKAEDKERLKQARLEEQARWQAEENEKRLAKEGKLPPKKAGQKSERPPETASPEETGEDTEPAEE